MKTNLADLARLHPPLHSPQLPLVQPNSSARPLRSAACNKRFIGLHDEAVATGQNANDGGHVVVCFGVPEAPILLVILSPPETGSTLPITRASSITRICTRNRTVDHQLYHQTIVEMEQKNVDREYIQGWTGGFMGNPKREEQRVTEAYESGYDDGANQNTSNYERWIAG